MVAMQRACCLALKFVTKLPAVNFPPQYLDGPEVDCDIVMSDGVPVYGAITDNWPTVGELTFPTAPGGGGGPVGARRACPCVLGSSGQLWSKEGLLCSLTHQPTNHQPPEPYFNETGSNCPSILPRKQQKELLELSVKSVQVRLAALKVLAGARRDASPPLLLTNLSASAQDAFPLTLFYATHNTTAQSTTKPPQCLGLKLGVFHVEAKYTSRGPRLIEVNCRMGGGPVR